MNGMLLALAIKPLVLVFMLLPGAILAYHLKRKMREGWLKRVLLFSWRV